MHRKTKCSICNEPVDRSACGQTLATATIEQDDFHTTKKTRYLFCERCALDLQYYLNKRALDLVILIDQKEVT